MKRALLIVFWLFGGMAQASLNMTTRHRPVGGKRKSIVSGVVRLILERQVSRLPPTISLPLVTVGIHRPGWVYDRILHIRHRAKWMHYGRSPNNGKRGERTPNCGF